MKKIILFILSLSILFVLPGCGGDGNGGETPSIHWAKSFGGVGPDSASSVLQKLEGGYIIAGRSESFGDYPCDISDFDCQFSNYSDLWVMEINSKGNLTWQKIYKETGNEEDIRGDKIAHDIKQTSDGGYIVAGGRHGGHFIFPICWVIKLDSNGNIQWQKAYNSAPAYSIQQTSDSGYIAIVDGVSVMKLDSNGNITWQKYYSGVTGFEWLSSIQQTSDGGYIVAGGTDTLYNGDFWVIKLNSSGAITWQKTYGGTGHEEASSIQQTSDDGYIVSGQSKSFGAGKTDYWILKLNSSGDIAWQKTYGGSGSEGASSIQRTSNGGYIVAGYTDSFGAGDDDFWVIKFDSTGNITWQKTYGGSGSEGASSIQRTSNGGYIVAGFTNSFGAGSYDVWVLRLKNDGTISSTNPSNIGADTSAIVQETSVVPSDTSVTAADSTLTSTDKFVIGVDTNATVQTQASD